MRRYFLIGFITIMVAALAGNVWTAEIPDPPGLGVWVLRQNSYLPLNSTTLHEVEGYRGITSEDRNKAFFLQEEDRIIIFSDSPPGHIFANTLDLIGGVVSGVFYKENDVPVEIFPVKVINSIPLWEIRLDLSKVFSSLILIHSGNLTSPLMSPTIPVFPLRYTKPFPKTNSEVKKLFGLK